MATLQTGHYFSAIAHFSYGDHTLLRPHHTTLQHEVIVVYNTIVRKSTLQDEKQQVTQDEKQQVTQIFFQISMVII